MSARTKGNHPFGAILVDEGGKIVLAAENTVVTESDVTGHAELNLVRMATKLLSPEKLERCTLYSSTEPCAMCAGAIHWSRIGRVVYALSELGLYELVGPSPEHLILPCRDVFAKSGSRVLVEGPAIEAEGQKVHEGFWV